MGAAENASKQDPRPPTRLHINAGTLYTSQGVPIVLRGVDALIAPGGQPGRGKDMDGKLVQIRSGRVFLSYDSLTRLLNHKLKDGKVKDLKISSDKGQVKIGGKVHKVLDIPFEIKGPVRVTPDGHLALHASTEKAAKLPIGGIADALGLNMQKVVGKQAGKGVRAREQDIYFDPDQLWGLPVHSRVTQAQVESQGLVLTFSEGGATHETARKR